MTIKINGFGCLDNLDNSEIPEEADKTRMAPDKLPFCLARPLSETPHIWAVQQRNPGADERAISRGS